MYDKKGLITLETSPYVFKTKETKISFAQTDIGTAKLVFQFHRNGTFLEINNNNVEPTIYLESGSQQNNDLIYVYDKIKKVYPESAKAEYTIPDKFLSESRLIKGQILLMVKGKKDIVTQTDFRFNIHKSLIENIPMVDRLSEINTFGDLRQNIIEQVEKLKEEIGSTTNIVKELTNKGNDIIKEINENFIDGKIDLENNKEFLKTELDEYKNEKITEINVKANVQKSEINNNFSTQVSNFENIKNEIVDKIGETGELIEKKETEDWQKHKITQDDGTTGSSVDLKNDISNMNDLNTGYYYSTNTPVTISDLSKAGFLNIIVKNNDSKKAFYTPYDNNILLMATYYEESWNDWEVVSNVHYDTGWIPLVLVNGAKTNTYLKEEGEDGFNCSYKTIKNNTTTKRLIRLNGNNAKDGQIITKVPSDFVESVQYKYIKTDLKHSNMLVEINTDGNIKVFYPKESKAQAVLSDNFYGQIEWTE